MAGPAVTRRPSQPVRSETHAPRRPSLSGTTPVGAYLGAQTGALCDPMTAVALAGLGGSDTCGGR